MVEAYTKRLKLCMENDYTVVRVEICTRISDERQDQHKDRPMILFLSGLKIIAITVITIKIQLLQVSGYTNSMLDTVECHQRQTRNANCVKKKHNVQDWNNLPSFRNKLALS